MIVTSSLQAADSEVSFEEKVSIRHGRPRVEWMKPAIRIGKTWNVENIAMKATISLLNIVLCYSSPIAKSWRGILPGSVSERPKGGCVAICTADAKLNNTENSSDKRTAYS